MAKKNFKEFVKEHKGKIAAGCMFVAGGVVGAVFCKKVAIPKFKAKCEEAEAAAEAILTMAGHWDYAGKGAECAYSINCDEWLKNLGENRVHFDDISLEVTGATLFGKKIET